MIVASSWTAMETVVQWSSIVTREDPTARRLEVEISRIEMADGIASVITGTVRRSKLVLSMSGCSSVGAISCT